MEYEYNRINFAVQIDFIAQSLVVFEAFYYDNVSRAIDRREFFNSLPEHLDAYGRWRARISDGQCAMEVCASSLGERGGALYNY